ncbi:potassium channel family protein [Clostridium swellfunianum]|uniref:potassium channel family protein n=1 Tax=Clostridium swellfunianum TaxID=1367462 RepID=UPI002030F5CF|nr:potassium channel family protein [Clostridium swellfunianum]MCM0647977.1 potassium channel family protein [Clostridium swellfunianum]
MRDLDFTNNERIEFAYDVIVGILAIVATFVVVLQFNKNISDSQLAYLSIADNVIYFIFVLDFFIRWGLSKDKSAFIRNHYVDLIAILPFHFFTNSPYGSLLKLMRVLTYSMRLIHNIKDVLYTNGFIYSLGSATVITILGSFAIYFFEKDTSATIKSYGDAFWWSIVTVTTVGYGDISPTTTAGRIIAAILMLSGIGFLSMLTSTVSTYFITKTNEKKSEIVHDGEKVVLDISELSQEKKKMLLSYYEFLKTI